ncbi:UPF0489 family protein [Paraburkholderia sacchari]|uniref:UPF0489 family protein n=1 Tax=Paraburkholderia sacchari TaxID=159450 RepID=UPI00054280FA|nr:UPF0489 family protein [Paraburkholderia sacchari]NLP65081.1 hypothetical protein [Paraburkholderia sacchari]
MFHDLITIGGKDVYIVEAHHTVLLPWAQIRRKHADAPALVTLDHHTDTMEAFRRYRYRITKGDEDAMDAMLPGLIEAIHWEDDKAVVDAVFKLKNDEHIRTALLAGIISRAFVVNLSGETWTEHDGIYESGALCAIDCDKRPHDDACMITHAAQVLESAYLDHELAMLNGMAQADRLPDTETAPYVLDIDLDYFHSEKSINPENPETFHRLVRNAVAVTIATEPDYVTELRCEGSDVTSASLLERMKQHIEAAMT